jgi:hypothetical protein
LLRKATFSREGRRIDVAATTSGNHRVPVMDRRFLLVGAAALAALPRAARAAPVTLWPGAGLEELEPIYAVAATRYGLSIRVASKGCTRKADFAFFVDRKEGSASIAFGRKQLDVCRGGPAGRAELVFTYDELGVAPKSNLFVLNPVVVPEAPPPRPARRFGGAERRASALHHRR